MTQCIVLYCTPILLFEMVLKLYEVHLEGILIIHVVCISVTGMIEAGIDGLYRGNNLGGIMQDIDPLNFIPLHFEGL